MFGPLIPSCIQVGMLQTSEVSETSEVSPEINAILIAKANYNSKTRFIQGGLEMLSGGGQDQLAMLDPLDADQLIGNLFYHQDGSANNQHLQAVVGIQVNMQGRYDLIMMGMLVVSQLVGEVPNVMIIDQSHRADRFLILGTALLLDQRRPDKIANRFRAVHIALLLNQLIKIRQKFFIKRDSESDGVSHG